MREKTLKIATIVSKALLFTLGVVLLNHLFAVSGIALAFAAGVIIPGDSNDTHTVDAAVPGFNRPDVSKDIAQLNPSRYPMDTIFRNGGFGAGGRVEKSASLIKKYYQFVNYMGNDGLSASGATTGGTTSATAVKQYTYASGDGLQTIWIAVNNGNLWQKEALLIMRDLSVSPTGVVATTGLTAKVDVVFFVEDVDGNAIKIRPLNGIKGINTNANNYVIPNFTSTTILYKAGNAKSDVALMDTSTSYYPTAQQNYCQNFIKTVQESVFEEKQAKEVQWDIRDMLKIAAYNIRAEIETCMYWGVAAEIDFAGRKRYTMNGIDKFITNKVYYGTTTTDTISIDQFINIAKTAFIGNSGSDRKLLLAGADLIGALMQFELSNTTYMKTQTKEKWGIVVTELETNYGVINVAHAPIITEKGKSRYGYLLDMEYVNKAEFVPMQQKEHDLISAGISNSRVISLQEVSTIWLDNPECHLIISPTNI